MAVIYMVHPVHGAKVAISEHEANYDEISGWTRYNPDTPVQAAVVDEPVNQLAPQRRGRRRVEPQED